VWGWSEVSFSTPKWTEISCQTGKLCNLPATKLHKWLWIFVRVKFECQPKAGRDSILFFLPGFFHWFFFFNLLKIFAQHHWLTPVILATQETEIRRMAFWSQPRQIVGEPLTGKIHYKKGLVGWLKE
jgi:hypothetical protein